MRLTTRGRYAVTAMADLAVSQEIGCECGPICLAEIAARQQLSLAYLEQLFCKLRRSGLVNSARGPGGGYRLALSSDAITIAEIVAAVHEPIRATGSGRAEAKSTAAGDALSGEKCRAQDLWAELGRQIEFFLEGITLADVVAGRVKGRAVRLQSWVGTSTPLAAE